MENELITINVNNINGEEANCVSLRELHKGLEVKTRFNDWSKRMFDYGFVENTDFILVTQKRVTNNPKSLYTERLKITKEGLCSSSTYPVAWGK